MNSFPAIISDEQALALTEQGLTESDLILEVRIKLGRARYAAMLAVSGGGARDDLEDHPEADAAYNMGYGLPAQADTAEPVFHLRSYGDVTEEQLLKLTTPQNETAELSDLLSALKTGEAALADIGDSEGDVYDEKQRSTSWSLEQAERRAGEALPAIRAAIAAATPSEAMRRDAERWISVNERLPHREQRVQFWDGHYCVGFGPKDPESRQWVDELSRNRDGEDRDTYTVTHWMPLPSPPSV